MFILPLKHSSRLQYAYINVCKVMCSHCQCPAFCHVVSLAAVVKNFLLLDYSYMATEENEKSEHSLFLKVLKAFQ